MDRLCNKNISWRGMMHAFRAFISHKNRWGLKFKVTGQGIYRWISWQCSISPKLFGRLTINFNQMFISVRQCAEPMTQLPRPTAKDTGQGQLIYPLTLCLFHIYWTFWAIFIKLRPNVPLSETMCKTYNSDLQNQGQGHTSRSCDKPFNSCPLHICWNLWKIFIKLYSNTPLSHTVCRAHNLAI